MLERIGIAVADPGGEDGGRAAPALVLRGTLRCKEALPVRGAGWPGVEALAELRLERSGGGVALAHGEARAHGAGAGDAAACGAAARQVLPRALAPVLAHLRAGPNLHLPRTPDGCTLRLTGVSAYGQYAAVARALARGVPGISASQVLRVSRGEVWFQLQTGLQPPRLAAALEGYGFGGFSLKQKQIAGGTIWITIESARGE
jgi:hypothetical protein